MRSEKYGTVIIFFYRNRPRKIYVTHEIKCPRAAREIYVHVSACDKHLKFSYSPGGEIEKWSPTRYEFHSPFTIERIQVKNTHFKEKLNCQ